MSEQVPMPWQPPAAQSAETSVAAVRAHAEATVQSRWIMAMQRPRDIETVRQEILRECDRPGFAEVARYDLPARGDGKRIQGLSIRFAEAAVRCMRNVLVDTPVVFDDDSKRIVALSVTDLETNVTYGQQITIPKRVERRSVKKGAQVLGTRKNSFGDTLYIIPASDDEILVRQNALVSKAIRTHVLRHVPGWLLDECENRVVDTLRRQDAEDPDAARRKVFDAFARLGITAEAVRRYVGHKRDLLTETELAELRGLFQAIADGQTSFDAALDMKHGVSDTDSRGPTEAEKKAREAIKSAGAKPADKAGAK